LKWTSNSSESSSRNDGIKPKISAPAVKADIEAALKRRAQKDAHEISVRVDGSDVTLSAAEIDEAAGEVSPPAKLHRQDAPLKCRESGTGECVWKLTPHMGSMPSNQ
jgi:hypothetical protein